MREVIKRKREKRRVKEEAGSYNYRHNRAGPSSK